MTIKRIDVSTRMSQLVIHGDTVYTAGQVAQKAQGESITKQTQNILGQIDTLLSQAGTDKTKLLSATIWLSSIDYYDEMNTVWDAWVEPGNAPARACVEAKLAAPQFDVEIAVVAAV
ncbi:MAG: RidA family protein [Arenicellales bacterium]|nr:RidA family protein [Arenicellales bacterium]